MRRARLEQIFEENELKATAEQTIEKLSIEKNTDDLQPRS